MCIESHPSENHAKPPKQSSPLPPKRKPSSPLPQKQQFLHLTPSDPSSSKPISAASGSGSGRVSPAQRSTHSAHSNQSSQSKQSNQTQSEATPKGKGKAPRPLPQLFPRKSGVKNANLPQPIQIRTFTIGKDDGNVSVVSSPTKAEKVEKVDKKRKSPSFRRSEEPEDVSLQASTSGQIKRAFLSFCNCMR